MSTGTEAGLLAVSELPTKIGTSASAKGDSSTSIMDGFVTTGSLGDSFSLKR